MPLDVEGRVSQCPVDIWHRIRNGVFLVHELEEDGVQNVLSRCPSTKESTGIPQKSRTVFFVKAAHLFVVHFPSIRNCFLYPYHTADGKICLKLDDLFAS